MKIGNKHILIFLAVLILLLGNGVVIPDIMECRNLVTAREMLTDGHWLMPTMNGALRLEKPPLPTWIAALTMGSIGQSWMLVRLVPALMGVFLLIYFYKLMEAVGESVGLSAGKSQAARGYTFPLVSSLILLTCYNFVLASKTVSWDIYCHAFQMAGIYYLFKMLTVKEHGWRYAALAGLMTGLSVMSKGPVSPYALLLPAILAAVIWTFRQEVDSRLFRSGSLSEILLKVFIIVMLTVVIGGAWYFYIYVEQSHASMSVLQKESAAWAHRNVRPWYYYWSFFTETAIWIPLCLASLVAPLWSREVKGNHSVKRVWWLGFLWTLFTLLLLSLLPEKKNRYLLPILIPASMMMGIVLWNLISQGRRWVRISLNAIVVCFVLFAAVGMSLLKGVLVNGNYAVPTADVSVPSFWAKGEEMRIEIVYDAGNKVKEVDLGDSLQVAQLPRPCRLMVSKTLSADSLGVTRLPGAKFVGTYDSNRHSSRLKMYKQKFRYDLYLLQ